MQYLVIGRDGNDDHALQRRTDCRDDHIALGDKMAAAGNMLVGAAILNEDGNMSGSVLLVDFESRADLDLWLQREPYVVGGVWKSIKVEECRVGPSFAHLFAHGR